MDLINHFIVFLLRKVGIKGIKRAISTSKMIKIIAIKKNRIEKGMRAELKKLNPHSKGLHFSRQLILFFETILEIIINKRAIAKLVNNINEIFKI